MDTITLAQDSSLQDLRNRLSFLPHVVLSWKNLGGIPSIFIYASLDDTNSWQNGIFYNSRYSIFVIHGDMKLEQISKDRQVAKLRKSKNQNIDSIVAKIQKWAES